MPVWEFAEARQETGALARRNLQDGHFSQLPASAKRNSRSFLNEVAARIHASMRSPLEYTPAESPSPRCFEEKSKPSEGDNGPTSKISQFRESGRDR